MVIGTHAVTLMAASDQVVWGPVLNGNATFDANVNGWQSVPGQDANLWTWAAPGLAVSPLGHTWDGQRHLRVTAANTFARDLAVTQYRVTLKATVDRAMKLTAGLIASTTAAGVPLYGITGGEFTKGVFGNIQPATAGTYTLDVLVDPLRFPIDYLFMAPSLACYYADPSGDTVAGAVKVDSLEVRAATFPSQDVTCLVSSVSIHHGRDDTDSQPEASTATLDMDLSATDALPGILDVGAQVRVTTTTGDTSSVRFLGRVTDVHAGWRDEGEGTPNAPTVQVMAASILSDLGRRVVGDVPWPQELDGARVSRIMLAAGIHLNPNTSDPGTVQILPRDVDSQTALPLAQEAATAARGLVWETAAGEVRYSDADHRRGASPSLSLDACDVLVTPTWRRTTEGLVNRVAVSYGVAPEGGEQPQYIDSNAASITKFGRYEWSASTELAALADAQSLAALLLARNSQPVWVMSELPVSVADLDLTDTAALLTLDVHSLLDLTGLPGVGNVPTSAALWVEGWTERLEWGIHELTLVVSGYCRTAPAPRWDDVDPTLTWDAMTGSWDAWVCVGPTPNRGRWTDVPASWRWNTTDPALTWDTWTA